METSERITTHMDSDIHTLEESLTQLNPQPLSADLLGRLDSAMTQAATSTAPSEDLFTESDSDLIKLLEGLTPSQTSPDLISRMDRAMANWHESVPVEEKVIEMKRSPKSENFLGWKSAAAVAALGAVMAFTTTGEQSSGVNEIVNGMEGISSPGLNGLEPELARSHSRNIRPASYDGAFKQHESRTELIDSTERGLLWAPDGSLLGCLEVKVTSQLDFRNDRGEGLVIKKPGTKIILKPLKVD